MFSAPTAYFLAADPHFGLSLLLTLCLTELMNGIVKLYSIRPRPLWVSTVLQRKGSVWEKVGSSSLIKGLVFILLFNTGFILPVVTCSIRRHSILLLVPRGQGASFAHRMVVCLSRDGSPHAPHRPLKSIPCHAFRF